MKHLLREWPGIKQRFKNKFLFFFFDFDGTLVPIQNSPEKAVLSEKARSIVGKLILLENIKVAFVSGRSLNDLKNKIGLKGAIYVGNHGLEIEGPKLNFRPALSVDYRKTLERIKQDLNSKLAGMKGCILEDKGLSLSLHFRLLARKLLPLFRTIFREAVILPSVKDQIKIKSGKKVFEVRPQNNWDKGKVVLWLLARQQFASGNKRVLPIYLGDDISDEDAFLALKNKGLTVFVGRPRTTSAQYYLRNNVEVLKFIENICRARLC